MTIEELEVSCKHYRQKIAEVEKSFSEFIQVIKKD